MSTLTLQPDATAGLDAQLAGSDADGNYATLDPIAVGNFSALPVRSVIKFDVSSIPADAVISGATLSLWRAGKFGTPVNTTLRAYRIKRAWVEAQVTYNSYSTGNSWSTAGVGNTTTDREATDIGSVSILNADAVGTQYDIALTPSAVQDWVDGTMTNNGLLLKIDDETDLYQFDSSDHGTAGTRPKLVVTYTVFTPSAGAYSSSSVAAGGTTATLVFDQPSGGGTWGGTYTEDTTKRPTLTVASPDPEGGAAVTRSIGISRIVSTSVVSTKLNVVVALKQPIYVAADEGTPTVSVAAGWITDTSSDTSGAATTQTVTNNSTLDFPDNTGTHPFICLEWTTFSGVFGDVNNEMPLGVVPHCHHGCKKVIFTFTPSSGPVVTETVTSPTKISRTKTLVGLGGLSVTQAVMAYLPTTDATTLAAGLVTVTAQIIPNIGTTAAKRSYTLEVYAAAALPSASFFVGSGGNDSNTGASWAQRVLTIEKAVSIVGDAATEGAIIEFGPGTYTAAAAIGNNAFLNSKPIILRPSTANGGTRANVILKFQGHVYTLKRLRLYNVTYDATAASSIAAWTGSTLGAATRSFQDHKVKYICSNASGRDGTDIGTFYGNINGVYESVDPEVYDYPGRPIPGARLRFNSMCEKISIDALRDCSNTLMDLTYDLTDPGMSHPDYLQALTVNECVADSIVAFDIGGEPIFFAPDSGHATGFRFWIDNAVIVQTSDDAFHAQVAVATEVLTAGASYWGNVTLPNALTFLNNVTSSGSITHTNTWYVGNVQRELLSAPAGCVIHSCFSTNSSSADDTDFGFTKGNPMFVDGAYNADFDANAIDYTPDTGSPLIEGMARITRIDVSGHNRSRLTAIGAIAYALEGATSAGSGSGAISVGRSGISFGRGLVVGSGAGVQF
jgi:hypothetical protein